MGNRVFRSSLIALVIGLVAFLSVVQIAVSSEPIRGPATDKIEYVRVDRPLAPEALRQGDIDVYIFSIPSEAEIEIGNNDPDIDFYRGLTGMDDILLNPAPAPSGQLNPFSITAVRYAMNFIFDRDFIVNDTFKGTAAPMYDYLGPFHPEAETLSDIIEKHNFTYDFDKGKAMVDQAMALAGANYIDKWYYNGEPVTIKAVIRVEDERRDIGDHFAAQLERLGFTVEYNHTTFGPAIDTVYGTDPAAFEWGFYTEGWGIGASRWNTWEPGCWGGSADPDLGDWCANMPGWGAEDWWNYVSPDSRIEILTTDIYYGRYDDLADREAKLREATDLIMEESVRIFGIRELEAYPARTDVEGLTLDRGQGLRGGTWAPREAYREGSTSLTFGNLWVWTETTTWNMFAGFNDVFSVDIARSTYDPAVWRHPFTSSAMPFRAGYEVTTAGPSGTVSVPSTAYEWDAVADEWVTVGSGVESTSKVVYNLSKYTQSKWHHGIDITMADILYSMASGWDIADDANKAGKESSLSSAATGYYGTIKGIVVPDEDTLEVYLDFYHFDDNEIAIFASPWEGFSGIGHNPWELMAAQEDVVFEKGLLAMDQGAADVYGVPWMSLVLSEHSGFIKDSLTDFLAENFFPSSHFTLGATTYDTLENARVRYQAGIDWFDEKGIIWISDGPFMLTQFDPEAQYAKTIAFRDASYPFQPGDWYYSQADEQSSDSWSFSLTSSVGIYQSESTLGVTVNATYGFDTDAGDLLLPPGFTGVEAYFWYPDNPTSPADFRKLMTSYHPIDYPSNWTLKVHTFSGTSGNTTLSWNSTEIDSIPANYSVTLYTPTQHVDMRTTHSYSWESEEDMTYSFTILVSAEVEFTLELRAGWNMVSLPVSPDDALAASSVLGDVGFYQLVTWSGSGYIVTSDFEAGKGYWLLVLEDVNVTVTGPPVDSLSLSLSPGWSMVGGTYDEVQSADVFPGFYQLVTWTGTGYTPATVFEPGKGYWALVLEETQIQLPPD